MDFVSQYLKGIDLYECVVDKHMINEPFFEGKRCEYYKKDSFKQGTLKEWFLDWIR